MGALVGYSVEQADLAALALRLKEVEGGVKLRTALIRNLKAAIAPAVAETKAGAVAISHGGGSGRRWGGDTTSLGDAIAKGIGSQVRMTGPRIGVKVRASKKGMPRGFRNAPNRMNRESFKHPVFGRWVTGVIQIGNPKYFDGPLSKNRDRYRAACIAAMDELALSLAMK